MEHIGSSRDCDLYRDGSTVYCTLRYERERIHIDYALDSSALTVRREKDDGSRTYIAPRLWPMVRAYGIDAIFEQDWFASLRDDPAYVVSDGPIRQELIEEDQGIVARFIHDDVSGASKELTIARFLTLEELMVLDANKTTRKGRNVVACRNIARAFSLMLRLFGVSFTMRDEREEYDCVLLGRLKQHAALVDLDPMFLKYADVVQ